MVLIRTRSFFNGEGNHFTRLSRSLFLKESYLIDVYKGVANTPLLINTTIYVGQKTSLNLFP